MPKKNDKVIESEYTASQPIEIAWARMLKAGRYVLGAVEKDLKAAGFPPLGWYDVLLELDRAGDEGLRPHVLEDHLLLAQHNVSRLLTRMEEAGLIGRMQCQHDKRGQLVFLLPEGRKLRNRMWPYYRRAIDRYVAQKLPDEDAARKLADLLDHLLEK